MILNRFRLQAFRSNKAMQLATRTRPVDQGQPIARNYESTRTGDARRWMDEPEIHDDDQISKYFYGPCISLPLFMDNLHHLCFLSFRVSLLEASPILRVQEFR